MLYLQLEWCINLLDALLGIGFSDADDSSTSFVILILAMPSFYCLVISPFSIEFEEPSWEFINLYPTFCMASPFLLLKLSCEEKVPLI